MSSYTASQLATIIKMAAKKDMPDLGEDTDQDFYIFEWCNMFLRQNARKAYVSKFSDAITLSSTGYVSFTRSAQPITDMFEPLMMYDDNDKQLAKRSSYDDTKAGWWREDAYSDIHVRNPNGTYRLKYLKYPEKITLGTQVPEYPPAGYGELISWVVSRIKYSKNFYAESQAMQQDANAVRLNAVKASNAARGTNSAPPSENDATMG